MIIDKWMAESTECDFNGVILFWLISSAVWDLWNDRAAVFGKLLKLTMPRTITVQN